MTTIRIAQLLHKLMVYQALYVEDRPMRLWEDLDPKDQAMYMDAVAWIQMESVTPDMIHDFWIKRMEAQGWIYGVIKDPVHKTHPCMCPYEQLTEYEKAKDVQFLALSRMLREA